MSKRTISETKKKDFVSTICLFAEPQGMQKNQKSKSKIIPRIF